MRRVGSGLDRLAGRIEELLQRERETAAELSHRLGTGLPWWWSWVRLGAA